MPKLSQQLPTGYRLQVPVLLNSLLPSLLRKPRLLAWVQALNSPAAWVYEQFAAFYFTTKTELSYNGQTLLLEKALNDRFDKSFRRIRIINSDTELSPVYLNFTDEQQPLPTLYFEDEGQPLLYLNEWTEYTNQVGFTVQLPRSLRPQEVAVQARIKQLKLALIRHKLIYI
jgi:hypothetical protein